MSSQRRRKQFQPTPEQTALAEHRKAKKQQIITDASQLQSVAERNHTIPPIAQRVWLPVHPPSRVQGCQIIKICTWNLLAQCLIRRDLFPTSDCLKAAQREHMLYYELLEVDADIICLQEVDRLEKLLPILEKAGYAHHYAAGPGKKHGCLIAFKKKLYNVLASRPVEYDTQEIRSDGNENARRGRSFTTRNIGSLILLESKIKENDGILVATTHLFWHPKQAAILFREVLKFRNDACCEGWPCIVGGDFNFAPDDPVYSLIVGDHLLPEQEERLTTSQVVHISVDPTGIPTIGTDEENEEGLDPDKFIINARPATCTDGLLSLTELVDVFSRLPQIKSVYDEGLGGIEAINRPRTFGHRVPISLTRRGRNEPEYTSYTHYWKTVLDYLFVLDPGDRPSKVIELLAPHKEETLKPGLPQKGVCSSDHILLAAIVCWEDPLH
ncbi:Endonuclease/exonuclease/phosphatase [Collybia nuda]|uniref:Endonuclease/exonuclease/phosphatase n=1 Tax=Collybia nuda TaxID=64659 RepID=A0A9P5Y420_9AGAR|nr:Endonuclease/exonuclease/phosphatase [Collybia nuda]